MSQLLINWLTNDIKLSRLLKPEDMDLSFRSGYLFADIFGHFKLLDSESHGFVDSPTPNIAVRNYCKLEPLFRAVGVPITSSTAYDLIVGKPGTASKVLYQLKTAFNDHVSSKEDDRFHPISELSKKKFIEKEHLFFVERLKSKFPRDAARQLEPIKQEVNRIQQESKAIHALKFVKNEVDLGIPNKPRIKGAMLDEESQRYLQTISERRKEEIDIRKQRNMRREIILEERKKLQEELARDACANLIKTYLERKTKQESEFEAFMDDIVKTKEEVIRNSLQAKNEYEAKEHEEEEAGQTRDNHIMRLFEHQTQVQTEMIDKQLQISQEAYLQYKHKRHMNYYRVFVRQMVEYAMDFSEAKLIYGEVPKTKLYELNTLLERGYPLPETRNSVSINDDQNGQSAENSLSVQTTIIPNEQASLDQIEILDDVSFDQYIGGSDQWQYIGEKPSLQEPLSKAVSKVLDVASSTEPKNMFPGLTSANLHIALLGKPLSGKSTLAFELADSCNLEILNPKDLAFKFQRALNEPSNENNKQILDISTKINDKLVKGESLSDELITAMLVFEIKRLASLPEPKGWILLDYPKTRAQAAALERELTGYEEPKAAKSGAKKPPSKDLKKKSAIENDVSKSIDIALKSFIDQVIILKVEPETAIKRLTGRRIDPLTKRIYNLDYAYPAADEPGVLQRLVQAPKITESTFQSENLAFDENLESLKEWFSRFNNILFVDSNVAISNVRMVIEKELSVLIISKKPQPPTGDQLPSKEVFPKLKAIKLAESWGSMEEKYVKVVKDVLGSLRKHRDLTAGFSYQCKEAMKKFLYSPDTLKAELINNFCNSYNAINLDTLSDVKVKNEWVGKAEELREKLFDLTDQKREKAESERTKLISSKWVEDQLYLRTELYTQLYQVELERFCLSVWFMFCFRQSEENVEFPLLDIRFVDKFARPEELLFEDLLRNKFGGAGTKEIPAAKEKEKPEVKGRSRSMSVTSTTGATPNKKSSAGASKKIDENTNKAVETFVYSNRLASVFDECLKLADVIIQPFWNDECLEIKKNFILRFERIKNVSTENVKALKTSAAELFQTLDELIGSQYSKDVENAKKFTQYLIQCVETKDKALHVENIEMNVITLHEISRLKMDDVLDRQLLPPRKTASVLLTTFSTQERQLAEELMTLMSNLVKYPKVEESLTENLKTPSQVIISNAARVVGAVKNMTNSCVNAVSSILEEDLLSDLLSMKSSFHQATVLAVDQIKEHILKGTLKNLEVKKAIFESLADISTQASDMIEMSSMYLKNVPRTYSDIGNSDSESAHDNNHVCPTLEPDGEGMATIVKSVLPLDTACYNCNKVFSSDDKPILYLGSYFHRKCFLCVSCNLPVKHLTFLTSDDAPICSKCSPKCHKCNESIISDCFIALETTFHLSCFKCGSCDTVIPPEDKFYRKGGKACCVNCMSNPRESMIFNNSFKSPCNTTDTSKSSLVLEPKLSPINEKEEQPVPPPRTRVQQGDHLQFSVPTPSRRKGSLNSQNSSVDSMAVSPCPTPNISGRITTSDTEDEGLVKHFKQNEHGTSLISVLSHDIGLDALTQYCTHEFCVEKVFFWMDVEQYRQRANTNIADAARYAKLIYEKYIKPNAEMEVKINEKLSASIEASIKNGNITANTFDHAQKQVFEAMETDLLPRFLESALGYRYLQAYQQRDSNRKVKFSTANEHKDPYEVISMNIKNFQKKYKPEKHYVYEISVQRAYEISPTLFPGFKPSRSKSCPTIYRKYADFQELHLALGRFFPDLKSGLPYMPGKSNLLFRLGASRSGKTLANDLDAYLEGLMKQPPKLIQSVILMEFLKPNKNDLEQYQMYAKK